MLRERKRFADKTFLLHYKLHLNQKKFQFCTRFPEKANFKISPTEGSIYR